MVSGGARGERFVEVDGESRPVLFTNRGLAEAERALERPILALLTEAQGGSFGVGDVATLLRIGLEAGRRDARLPGPQVTINDAWAVMDALGFTAVATVVFEAIADVLSHGQEAESSEEDEGNPR